MKKKLTASLVKNAKPRDKEYYIWDSGHAGLGLRVRPSGKRSYVYKARLKGSNRQLKMTLGHDPATSLADARTRWLEHAAIIDAGDDPRPKKKADGEGAVETVGELIAHYLEVGLNGQSTQEQFKPILERHFLPRLGTVRLTDVEFDDFLNIINAKKHEGYTAMAHIYFSVCRAMFNYAVGANFMASSPFWGRKSPQKKKVIRDRYLDRHEIHRFWRLLDQSNSVVPESRLAFQLYLVTGLRKCEVSQARTKNIDLDRRIWTIPADEAKNGRRHQLPLSDLAIKLLKELIALHPESEWLMPSPRTNKSGPVAKATLNHHLDPIRDIMIEDGSDLFTVHDLRRTAATVMREHGVSSDIVDLLLNHRRQGMAAVYDQSTQREPMRQGMEILGEAMAGYLNNDPEQQGENVVEFAASATG